MPAVRFPTVQNTPTSLEYQLLESQSDNTLQSPRIPAVSLRPYKTLPYPKNLSCQIPDLTKPSQTKSVSCDIPDLTMHSHTLIISSVKFPTLRLTPKSRLSAVTFPTFQNAPTPQKCWCQTFYHTEPRMPALRFLTLRNGSTPTMSAVTLLTLQSTPTLRNEKASRHIPDLVEHFSLPRLSVVSDLQLPTSASPDCLLYQICNSPLQPPQTVCCIRSATPHFSLPRLLSLIHI